MSTPRKASTGAPSTPSAASGRPRAPKARPEPATPPGPSGAPETRPAPADPSGRPEPGKPAGRPERGKPTAPPGGPERAKPAARSAAAGKPAAPVAARTPPPPPGPGLVVGPVPALARVAGAVSLAAAAVLLVAPAFPLARSGGRDLGGAGNLLGFVPVLPLVAAAAVAGVLGLRGRLPRLGLAVLLSAGTLAAGLLLRTLALLDTGARSTLDLPLGIDTSARYEVAAGLVVTAAGYALLVAAALLAAVAWPRTLMEDDGGLDPRRPRLGAWGLAAGVLAALVLGMAPYSSAVPPGAPTLPERAGPDLLGALVLALGAAAWAVVAATLHPRLAVVGAYAGVAAVLLSEGLASWLLVARSPGLGPSAGGVGTLLAALAVAALAVSAADLPRSARGRA